MRIEGQDDKDVAFPRQLFSRHSSIFIHSHVVRVFSAATTIVSCLLIHQGYNKPNCFHFVSFNFNKLQAYDFVTNVRRKRMGQEMGSKCMLCLASLS